MKTIALIEKGKDGSFGIYTPDLNHTIVGDGKSVLEAKVDFVNSTREMIASYIDNGKTLPTELIDIEFEFKYDIASIFNYYDFINVSKFAKRIGLNASLMRQYKSGKQYISENQIARIEDGLHQLANEIGGVKLV